MVSKFLINRPAANFSNSDSFLATQLKHRGQRAITERGQIGRHTLDEIMKFQVTDFWRRVVEPKSEATTDAPLSIPEAQMVVLEIELLIMPALFVERADGNRTISDVNATAKALDF
jgi:hypothetical protein